MRTRIAAGVLLLSACGDRSGPSGGAAPGAEEQATSRNRSAPLASGSAEAPTCDACGQVCTAAAASACFDEAKTHLSGEAPRFDLALAAQKLERGCNGGNAQACARLGLQVQDGRGVQRDPVRAVTLYERACKAGIGVGCFNLGLWYRSGRAEPDGEAQAKQAFARALAAYETQCSGAHPTYCENLGYLYETGIETPVDLAKAEAAYKRGCDADEQAACLQLGLLELARGSDPKGAARRLDVACERGQAEACGALGQHYLGGIAPYERDAKRGLANLERGCLLGAPFACQQAAAALLGEQGDAGRAAASSKLERACALGASTGCHFLAMSALRASDDKTAFVWLTKACGIGHPEACALVGAAYQTGRGVSADPMLALAHFEDACHLGDFGACVEVAIAGRPLGLSPEREAAMRASAAKAGITLPKPKP